MKMIFALCLGATLAFLPLAHAQNKETEDQIKERWSNGAPNGTLAVVGRALRLP
jgi:hypothetical protein